MFDLQLFADETDEKEYGDILDGAEDFSDENSDIPADLEGIPENIAREVMQKSEVNKQSDFSEICFNSLCKI